MNYSRIIHEIIDLGSKVGRDGSCNIHTVGATPFSQQLNSSVQHLHSIVSLRTNWSCYAALERLGALFLKEFSSSLKNFKLAKSFLRLLNEHI